MRKYRCWLTGVLIFSLMPLLGLGSFNYYIDPLWTFTHENHYNSVQHGFNERQQKTNFLTFHPPIYDSVLVGSSRATYINQNDFEPYRTFNYAVNNMLPEEYKAYIDYFTLTQGQAPKVIFLALDFFATNKNAVRADNFFSPSYYIDQATSPFYRYKLLTSKQVFDRSYANYLNADMDPRVNYTYDRRNVKYLQKHSEPEEAQKAIVNTVNSYGKTLYADYSYISLQSYWQELKKAYPDSKLVVFTTPVAAALLELLKELEIYPYYEVWLRELTEEFGQVWHFMLRNEFTGDIRNFFDGSHIYPQQATLLVDFIMGRENDFSEHFALLLTPENIEEQLLLLRTLNGVKR